MKTLEQNISELCKELEVPSPIEFLTQIMAGHDPRRVSDVFTLVQTFEEKYGKDKCPDDWDYAELVYLIKHRYQHFPVTLGESHQAAKQIMEYTHAKKKQIDHSGHILDSGAVKSLTEEEVELFLEKFNAGY